MIMILAQFQSCQSLNELNSENQWVFQNWGVCKQAFSFLLHHALLRHVFALSLQFFVWPECRKTLENENAYNAGYWPNLCWTLTFTWTFTIHCHCYSHRQHSPLPVTITINCHCHCHHLSLSVLSPLLPSIIINLPPLPLFLHLSTIPGHDHLLLSLFIVTVTS